MSLYAGDEDTAEYTYTRYEMNEAARILDSAQNSLLGLPQVYEEQGLDTFEAIESLESFEATADDKSSFKRRASPYGYIHNLAISIEANFHVPIIGSQNYFGRIYFLEGNDKKIDYRDEQIAEKRYSDEKRSPKDFYTSGYDVSKINSTEGLNLVKAAGAVVNLKSGNLLPSKGGRLYLKVKAPGTTEMNMTIDVVVSGRNVQCYYVSGNQKYAFNSLTINAEKTFLSGTSILNGILSIEFNQNGRFSYSVKP
jgi:hypothetical protein